MFEYIKNSLRNKSLRTAISHSKKRKSFAHNFETTDTMGIIFPFTPDGFDVLNLMKNIAKKYDIAITFIIYFPQDKLPEGTETSSMRIFFSNNECNWFGKPKTAAINDFINTKFDILIDLSSKLWFPLQYIASSSYANFKIGRINEQDNPFDFLLLGSNTEEQFINELEKYINKIK
jgi:hypothetical protein